MKSCCPNVWLWSEPDFRWKDKVISHIKKTEPIDKAVVVLHCAEVEDFDESLPLPNYLLNLCEKFNIFINERTMFLKPKDFLQAAELSLRRLKPKDHNVDAGPSSDDLIQCYSSYIEHFKNENVSNAAVLNLKKFIEENNFADLWLINDLLQKHKDKDSALTEYLSTLKFLILGIPSTPVLKTIIGLMTTNSIQNVIVETPLNISLQGSPTSSPTAIEVTSEPLNVKDIALDTERELKLASATVEYTEDVIISFLSLLVNSRNELALSKAMISPIIDLSHEAFTELKHLSQEKEMPLCQTAISYVMRIRLGGKGYAPAETCPMLPHLKSLEVFVDVLNQIQTVIEEDLTPISAVKRLINILKNKLLKCANEKLRTSSIQDASENLKAIAVKVLNIMRATESKNSAPQVCQEGLDFLHNFINYINCSCWNFDVGKILEQKNTKRTPISLPPLLGYFRSPEEESSCDANSVHDEDSLISNKSLVQPPVSYFHHSESSSVSVTCVDSQTPSKTSFKDCLYYDENDSHQPKACKPTEKKLNSVKGRKRSILGEITNDNTTEKECQQPKKLKNSVPKSKERSKVKETTNKSRPKMEAKANKPKGSKKFKLIEGQGKITSFFNR